VRFVNLWPEGRETGPLRQPFSRKHRLAIPLPTSRVNLSKWQGLSSASKRDGLDIEEAPSSRRHFGGPDCA
jgi:hypothetical protein